MDGGHKSVATGLSGYTALRHHHNVETMRRSKSFMDQEKSELHTKNWRQGRLIRDAGVKIFQIETTLNNDTFPEPWDFLQKREWEMNAKERLFLLGTKKFLDKVPRKSARTIFQGIRAPYGLTSIQA